MFKKLFSVHTGADAAANNLIDIFKDNRTTQNKLTKACQDFIDKIKACNPDEASNAIKRVADLILLPDVERASLASLICGNLVENGYPAGDIYKVFTPRYKQLLQTAKPSLLYLRQQLAEKRNNDDGDEVEDEFEMLERLTEEREKQYAEEVNAIRALNKLYSCGIAAYSLNAQYMQQAAKELSEVLEFSEVSLGCNWLAQLFTVLFNQPLMVINTVNNKGIIAEMSGVADNVQLQQYLMALPELLDSPSVITKEMLDVIQGTGMQSLNKSITGIWNLNNWEYVKHYQPSTDAGQTVDMQYWIWAEGIPADIHVFEDYRVIILTPPSYKRDFNVQRMFSALKASIIVTKVLTGDEITGWMEKFKH